MTGEYTRFIILSFGRSGSTLLAQAMQSTPAVVCFGEVFNASTPTIEFGVPGHGGGQADYDLRARDPAAFLRERVFSGHDPGVKAVGFKFNYNHFWRFEGIVDVLTGDPDLYVIHLTRRNALRTLVSLRLAEQTGKWLEYEPEPSLPSRLNVSTLSKAVRDPQRAIAAIKRRLTRQADSVPIAPTPKEVAIEVEDCRTFFERTEFSERHWDELFAKHRVLHMTYEDLSRDLQAGANRALTFLGLEEWPVSATLRKQNPEPLRELVANYDELKAAFAGTPQSGFFDE